MIIFLNGAFGIGKTTVARAVQRRLPSTLVYDPERIGYILQRLPRWVTGHRTDDYQDLPLWRSLTSRGVWASRLVQPHVIVPMAFSNVAYLREISQHVEAFEPRVRHVCLTAPLDVVQERLRQRGADPTTHAWQYRRAAECCEAHQHPEFGEHIPTARRPADEIAQDIISRLATPLPK
jgi:chloramphenicol 3-O-phosphotransferase